MTVSGVQAQTVLTLHAKPPIIALDGDPFQKAVRRVHVIVGMKSGPVLVSDAPPLVASL